MIYDTASRRIFRDAPKFLGDKRSIGKLNKVNRAVTYNKKALSAICA